MVSFQPLTANFAVARVDADDDLSGKLSAKRAQKFLVVVGGGADDDPRHTQIQRRLHRIQPIATRRRVPRTIPALADAFDFFRVNRPTFHRAVQIDDVDKRRAFLHPVFGGLDGIVEIDRLLVHFALKQTHAAAIFDIDGGNDQHKTMANEKWQMKNFRWRSEWRPIFFNSPLSMINCLHETAEVGENAQTRSPGSSPGETGRQTDAPSRCWRRSELP